MKQLRELVRILFLVLVLLAESQAQKKYILQVQLVDSNSRFPIALESGFANRLLCTNYINSLTKTLHDKNYLSASVDSVYYGIDTAKVWLFTGKIYEWAEVDIQQNDPLVLFRSGWEDSQLKIGALRYEKLRTIQQKMLDYYQENGYPFAKITLDSIRILENRIYAVLRTNKGELYKIDSIRTFGTAKISNTFLQKQLNISNGSVYKKSILDAIPKRIKDLPYVQQQFPYNLTMLSTSAVVNLYLQPRKSSIINVLLGVIPQPNPNGIAQNAPAKLFLSGDANILLNNLLGNGETIGLTYQQLSINSRRLHLQYQHPYFLKTNYGIDFLLDMYKRDSSYLNIEAQAGASYNLGQNTKGRLFVQVVKTNTYPDTATIRQTKKLPDNLDIKFYNIGFQYDLNSTDFKRNPQKGNEVFITTAFGTKKIFENSGVKAIVGNGFDYATLYDTLKKNTYQFKVRTNAAHYFKIRKQTVLKTAFHGGLLLSQNYFRNELFQIGGFKLLRGFDEESQFCNQYAVATAEYRYLIAAESYFFIFMDGGYTRNQINTTIKHTYFGTGAGLNFTTKAGLFNLSFAVGTRNDIPLGFKQAKLHFGYVNVF